RLEPRALLDLDATPAPLGIGVVAVDEIAGGRVLLVSVQGTVAGVALPDRIPGVRWPDELPGLARCPPVIDGRDLPPRAGRLDQLHAPPPPIVRKGAGRETILDHLSRDCVAEAAVE